MSNFKPCAAIMPLAIEACELGVFSGKLPPMGGRNRRQITV
jgi:hypothetical protein